MCCSVFMLNSKEIWSIMSFHFLPLCTYFTLSVDELKIWCDKWFIMCVTRYYTFLVYFVICTSTDIHTRWSRIFHLTPLRRGIAIFAALSTDNKYFCCYYIQCNICALIYNVFRRSPLYFSISRYLLNTYT